MSSIAFIGLGVMGRGMVTNLLQAGHDLTVWNRSGASAVDFAPAEVRVVASIAAAVHGAEFVMYCLSDDTAVQEVVLQPAGLAELVEPNAIAINLSTISPEVSAAESDAYALRKVRFLDAPVFGSKDEANTGGLWIVVGGERETFDAARAVLAPISESVHYMGKSGNGARMKLAGNLLVAAQLEALGESLTLAKKAGLDLQDVLNVLKVTDFRSPIFDGVGASVIAGDYAPSFALALMLKDAKLVRNFAADLGVRAPGTLATLATIERAVDAGWGEENASALIKIIANDADVDLSAH